MDYEERLQQLEAARKDFGRKIQAFERDFGHSSYLNRAPKIEDTSQIADVKIFADRFAMLHELPKNCSIAEVGVDKGHFSRKIIEACDPSQLVLIDIDLSRLDPKNETYLRENPKVQFFEGRSEVVLAGLEQTFEWIYIDGDHSYAQVQKDIAVATPLVAPGGFLAFNDYTLWSAANMMNYGVSRAVNEFLNSTTKWTVAYFAFQGGGYHDLVLKRIDE